MAARLATVTDLLPLARSLEGTGHAVALLDSPPDNPHARWSHLVVLDEPTVDRAPTLDTEHLCLATYDWGLERLGVASRHGRHHSFGLLAYPVAARLTLDRVTGRLERTGDTRLFDRAKRDAAGGNGGQAGDVRSTLDRDGFAALVREAQAWIAEGHTYQTNLSLRLDVSFDGEPADLFARLRGANPSPYQALLLAPEVALASASPELLVRTDGAQVTSRPIAGTRPRGATPDDDRALEAELVANAKENAEHAMLVDLARNDVGRVARYGSVHVPDLAVVERYSHVMHLVSEVRAELAEGCTAWDAFEALFPCGTITGAPKKRSCEIIDGLEPTARGCYTGSLGLVTPEWSVWNILIRTAVVEHGVASVQAGAGIVADSDPAREHDECLHKARALLEALGVDA